jgi:acetyl esterase/lipase
VIGPPSLTRWLSLRAYGLVTSTLFGATTSPIAMRARFERFARSREALRRAHPALAFEDLRAGALGIESVCAVEAPSRVLLHLHGGGYFMGSPASYRNRAMRLGFRLDAEVLVPAYRLAPEHPYPAALDDALAAFRAAVAARRDRPIFLSGDSAGGGLALALLLRLRALGLPPPAGAILLSPWTDLTASGASVDANQGKDLWFTRRHLETWARHYAGGAELRSPELSPVFADLAGLPPLLLLAAEDELLLDDARRVHEAALRAGVDSRLLVGRGMQHDWPLTLPWLPESKHAWREMRRFVDERTGVAAGLHRAPAPVSPGAPG